MHVDHAALPLGFDLITVVRVGHPLRYQVHHRDGNRSAADGEYHPGDQLAVVPG